jgi:hypothetical protein
MSLKPPTSSRSSVMVPDMLGKAGILTEESRRALSKLFSGPLPLASFQEVIKYPHIEVNGELFHAAVTPHQQHHAKGTLVAIMNGQHHNKQAPSRAGVVYEIFLYKGHADLKNQVFIGVAEIQCSQDLNLFQSEHDTGASLFSSHINKENYSIVSAQDIAHVAFYRWDSQNILVIST